MKTLSVVKGLAMAILVLIFVITSIDYYFLPSKTWLDRGMYTALLMLLLLLSWGWSKDD